MKIKNFIMYRMNDIKTTAHQVRGKLERRIIKNDDFSIISNNCWGGWVYRYYGLPYTSPTVGNFMIAEDYLKFIQNLRYYLDGEIEIISPEQAHAASRLAKTVEKFGTYPIGRIKDVDIHFLHDRSWEKAVETWNRRKLRINYNKIIIKFSMQNLCKEEDCKKFNSLPFPNKILFVPDPIDGIDNAVVFKRDHGRPETRDEGGHYQKYINMTKYIRNMKETKGYF